jgi:hypothetical protein
MNNPTAGGHGARRDRNIEGYKHDSYRMPGKLKEPTVCSTCGALYQKGRWTWGAGAADAERIICPACLRIQDKNPKGYVTLKGTYPAQHRDQVMGLIRNIEAQEKKSHPMARVMTIEDRAEGLVVLTTDAHLPRRIGEALKHSHHGELDIQYDQDEEFIRIMWTG